MKRPVLLVADKNNKIYDIPEFAACGMSGDKIFVLSENDLIPMPSGAKTFFLPERKPVGFNLQQNAFQEIADRFPVAAFVPPGYTQLFNCAYQEEAGAKILPLFSYAPLVWYKNRFHVPAVCVDRRKVHDLSQVSMGQLRRNVQAFRKTENRLIRHLGNCAINYRCPNAVNFFLGRYECPLPTSPHCNARCLGCISFQPKNSCVSSQERINFTPLPEEIAEVALIHLKDSADPIVSFGQGCEGEPLLTGKIIQEAIRIIRSRTNKGTIHMNTNASLPQGLENLFRAGLDSIRVSFNSLRKEYYDKYYCPQGYAFEDVIKSVILAKKMGKFTALNYLTMPGFTDQAEEWQALKKFLRKTNIDMIQWRNLNFDPRRYFQALGLAPDKGKLLGIKTVMENIKREFPRVRHGYFNVPKGK